MMKPWPGMSRGTEWTVPIIPGFVIVPVVPAKSSGVSLFVRTLRISSSYAREEAGEVERRRRALMFGTSSVREPSGVRTSTASPRFTWSWCTTDGLAVDARRSPSSSPGTLRDGLARPRTR